MKKILRFLLLTISLTTFTSMYAQDAKQLFSKVPDSVIPYLSSVNRADFIDFLESKMKAQVKNKFGNTSEMTDLTSDYIRIQMTPQSTWEMKVLPLNDTIRIICTVSTACAPVCDSDIQFYSADWKLLPTTDYLTLPVMDDFYQTPDSTQLDAYNRFRLKADMLLVKAGLSKETKDLTFTFTTPEYLGSEKAQGTEPVNKTDGFLRNPLVYTWGKGSFTLGN